MLPSQCQGGHLVGHGIPGTEGRLEGVSGFGLLLEVAVFELMSGVGHTGGHRSIGSTTAIAGALLEVGLRCV